MKKQNQLIAICIRLTHCNDSTRVSYRIFSLGGGGGGGGKMLCVESLA